MANEEQFAILKQGVDVWNKWRQDNPYALVDLRGISFASLSLKQINLHEADLSEADLSGAFLGEADVSGAIMIKALLRGTFFYDADLNRSNLHQADLHMAGLGGASLRRANLKYAYLRGTDLKGADFRQVQLGYTVFVDTDLSSVKGLESVQHRAPSYIGIDTIYKSKARIPEIFLRGAGIPDDMIAFMRSLRGKAIPFYSCFISYSSKDENFSERLYGDLQSNGVRCFFAPHDMRIGDKIRDRIEHEIRDYDKLLLVLSENSIVSDWVEKEVETAFEKERQQKWTMLFPVRIDDTVMTCPQAWAADIRRTRHIGDMTEWKDHDQYQKAFERLLRDLKAENAER